MFLNANAMINSLGNPFRDIYYVFPWYYDYPQVPQTSVYYGTNVVKLVCVKCNSEYLELTDSMLNSQRICNVCMDEE